MWLNVTVHSQSEVYMAVRQLEFTLLQMAQQIDDLLAAVRCVLQGRLPISLVNPAILTTCFEMYLYIYHQTMNW